MVGKYFQSSTRFDFWTLTVYLLLVNFLFSFNGIEIASYTDNITPYVSGQEIEEVIQSLGEASEALFKWFSDNSMKSTAKKYGLLVGSSDKTRQFSHK